MKSLFAVLSLLISFPLIQNAQQNKLFVDGLRPLDEIPIEIMPALNNEQLIAKEMIRRGPSIPPKFAESIQVNINTNSHGLWERTSNGTEVWRLRIKSKGAKSLNLGFTNYQMPPQGKLMLYKPDRSTALGPFTPADNEEHAQLWTPVLPGDEIVVEVQLPENEKSNLGLEIGFVNHDYMDFFQMSGVSGSGSCNLDVICGEADGWGIVDQYRDIIRSVAMYSINGTEACTGFLINNTNSDCTPFFMTAAHCDLNSGNAGSIVTYWNYQSPDCRQPGSSDSGSPGNGSLDDFNTGAIHRATYVPSDVTLVELDDAVSSSANAFFAGWSIEYLMPQDTVICIHHPDTDEKRITFEFDPTVPTIGGANEVPIDEANHIRVPGWDIGTTEGGSSGSPLFNNRKQVVGQLHGGAASCSNASNNDDTDDWDYYGWFYTSWYGGGTPNTALRFWLDPHNTGFETWYGKENCSYNMAATPYYRELCAPEQAIYELANTSDFDGDVTITLSNVPSGAIVSFSQNPVPLNDNTTLTISTDGVATGVYAIEITATDGTNESFNTVILKVTESTPDQAFNPSPENNAVDVTTSLQLSWESNIGVDFYQIQVATDELFTNIIAEETNLESTTFSLSFLEILSTYYWRVKSNNTCGESTWSDVWNFTTADISCGVLLSEDTPVVITTGANGIYTSTVFINSNAMITDLNVVDLDITHSYVGDLSATLESPGGIIVELFDRPGVPETMFGCDNADLFVSFDDDAFDVYADFEEACDDNPAIGGVFQSIGALSLFIGEQANGEWTLTVEDNILGDGGSVNGWKLELCTIEIPDISVTPSANSQESCVGNDIQFSITLGEDFDPSGVDLSVNGLPSGFVVDFDNNPAMPGDVVLVTISNITLTGIITIAIQADDGTNVNSAIVELTIDDAPEPVLLNSPADAATNVSITPTLEWEESLNATSYQLEVATDASFANIIEGATISNNSFTIPTPLEFNTSYVWRVIAENSCGETFSSSSSFTTEMDVAVEELEGNSFLISPNPTSGDLLLSFAKALDKELTIEVYAIDGKLLQQSVHVNGAKNIPLALNYASGVYILRLKTENSAVTRRVVVQR